MILKAYAFIDGSHFRTRLRQAKCNDEFDPWHAVQTLHGQHCNVERLFYYDGDKGSEIEGDDAGRDPDKLDEETAKAQQAYLQRVDALPFTHVVRGGVRITRGKLTQKGVDIRLAVDAFRYASQGKLDVVVLGVGDADFLLLASAIRELGPYVYVAGFKKTAAKNLCDAADKVFFLDGYEHDFGDWALSRSSDDPWPTWAGSTPVENVLSHN